MPESISPLAELGYQYGPFLFAVLYIMVVTTRTSKSLKEVNTREPEAPKPEKQTRRLVYLGNWAFSFVLVIASTIWWWSAQSFPHVFTGTIEGLTEAEMVSAPNLYFRPIFHETHPEAPRERDEQFLVVQSEPVHENQFFTLRYCKGRDRSDYFLVPCSVGVGASYKIEWSDSAEQNVLVLVARPPIASLFGSTVMAAEIAGQPLALAIAGDPARSMERDIISTLQDERSSLGDKINAVERLAELDDDLFTRIVETVTDKESMIQTLLDLSRHSDKELAYKARKVIEGRYDVERALVTKVASGDDRQFEQTREILQRIEPAQAMAILDSAYEIDQTSNRSKIASLRDEMKVRRRARTVIPTASKDGDRYYVQAEWAPDDSGVVACLTELFHEELGHKVHKRTIEDERIIMKDRSTRLVWWHSKEWALWIAEKIEACGATAEFVGY